MKKHFFFTLFVALFITTAVTNIYAQEQFQFRVTVSAGESFAIPTSGGGPNGGRIYEWDIDFGDGTSIIYSGASSPTSDGILHTYTNTGSYIITIKPTEWSSSGAWFEAFGFYANESGANSSTNKDKVIAILSEFTPLMTRTQTQINNNSASNYEWAYTFYGCSNLLSTGPGFSDDWNNITTVRNNFAESMFENCFRSYFTMELTFNLPEGITKVEDNFAYKMFANCSGSNFKMSPIFNLPKGITTVGDEFAAMMFQNCKGSYFTMNSVFNLPEGIITVGDMFANLMFSWCSGASFTMNNVFNLPSGITSSGFGLAYGMFRACTGNAFKVNSVFTFLQGDYGKTIVSQLMTYQATFDYIYNTQSRTARSIIGDLPEPSTNKSTFADATGFTDLAYVPVNWGGYAPIEPNNPARNIIFSPVTATSTTIYWTKGNGEKRVVFMKAVSSGEPTLSDFTSYEADSIFGNGTAIDGWYCVYNGNGTRVNVTGLSVSTTYRVMVVEYNGDEGFENYTATTGINNPANVTTVKDFFQFQVTLEAGESFTIPTSGGGPDGGKSYNWNISWGDGVDSFGSTGSSSVTSSGISHTFTAAGTYTITITPAAGNDAWLAAFGFYSNLSGANAATNKAKVKAILAELTPLMTRTTEQIAGNTAPDYEWAYAFYECTNLNSTGPGFSNDWNDITKVGNNFADQMFANCSSSSFTMNALFNLPSGITTTEDAFAYQRFSGCSDDAFNMNDAFNLPVGITTVGDLFVSGMLNGCSGAAFTMNDVFNFPSGITTAGSDFASSMFNQCSGANFSMNSSFNLPLEITSVGSDFLSSMFGQCSGSAFEVNDVFTFLQSDYGKTVIHLTNAYRQTFYGVSNKQKRTAISIIGTLLIPLDNRNTFTSATGFMDRAYIPENWGGDNTTPVAPTTQASDVAFSHPSAISTTISWIRGNGERNVVFMKAAPEGTPTLTNTTYYTANPIFGAETSQLGSTGWYCVYNGIGNSVNVTGLEIGTQYRVAVIEYNGSKNIERYATAIGAGNPANITTFNEKFQFQVAVAAGESFAIPTSGYGPYGGKSYNWDINWGDDSAGLRVSGNSSIESDGISHTYPIAGTYTITITPAESTDAWFNAFGFYSNTIGANNDTNKAKVRAILSELTPLMTRTASQISGTDTSVPKLEWAHTFYECINLSTTGPGFSSSWNSITTTGEDFANSMFAGCSGDAFTMDDVFNLPQGITTVGHYFASRMFSGCSGAAFTMNNVFNLPQEITTIDYYFAAQMFLNCSGASFTMNNVFTMPQKITKGNHMFANYMFSGCSGAAFTMGNAFNLPAEITEIGQKFTYYMFSGCSGAAFTMNDVFNLPAGITTSMEGGFDFFCYMFSGCSGAAFTMNDVFNFPQGLTNDGAVNFALSMFSDCSGASFTMNSVFNLPQGLTSEGYYFLIETFAGCSGAAFKVNSVFTFLQSDYGKEVKDHYHAYYRTFYGVTNIQERTAQSIIGALSDPEESRETFKAGTGFSDLDYIADYWGGNGPTTPWVAAKNVTFTFVTPISTTINWSAGNGAQRVVFMKVVSDGKPSLSDHTSYTADSIFGAGTEVDGWYCVYNGNGTQVNVTGLNVSTIYRVMVVEYNGDEGFEKYTLATGTNNPANVSTVVEDFQFQVTVAAGESFAIPTSGGGPAGGKGYSWNINWGDGADSLNMTGTSSIYSRGISHTYTDAGTYTITITANGNPNAWLAAFGFYVSTSNNANDPANKAKVTAILSEFTPAMTRTNNQILGADTSVPTYEWAFTFDHCPNLTSTGPGFSSSWNSIAAIGDNFAERMFMGCSSNDFTISNVFNLPQGITTVGEKFASQMFMNCSGSGFTMGNAFNLPAGITAVGEYFAYEMFSGCFGNAFRMNDAFNLPPLIASTPSFFANAMFSGCSGTSFTMNNVFNLPQRITTAGSAFAYMIFFGCSGAAFTMNDVFNLPAAIAIIGDSFACSMFSACSGTAFTMNDVFNLPQGITNAENLFLYRTFSECSGPAFKVNSIFTFLQSDYGKSIVNPDYYYTETFYGVTNRQDRTAQSIIGTLPTPPDNRHTFTATGFTDQVYIPVNWGGYGITPLTPTTQASDVTFSQTTATSTTISWTNGNGALRAVFMKVADTGEAGPSDNSTYTGDAIWGSGTQLAATGWYCIYNGVGDNVTVSGLTGGFVYRVHVCEYNGYTGAEKYLIANAANNPNNIVFPYILTYNSESHGSLMGDTLQTANYGANGTAVTAIPNQGYHFVSWSDGNTNNPRTDANVTADITATASFAINTYTLTYSAGNNGTISGSSPQTVDYGSNGTAVTAIPNQGYHFVSWSDGNTNNPRTDVNATADITVTASFAATKTLSIDSDSITVTPESLSGARDGAIDAIASGGSKPYQYLITNATGDTIQGWSTDGNFNGLSAGNYVVHVQDANGDTASISITVDLTTDVVDLEVVIGKLTVYPNPTSGKVNIEFKSENKDFELLVIDITGKIILQRSYSISEHITFDLSGQAKGIYIVQLRTNNRQINKKLIVN